MKDQTLSYMIIEQKTVQNTLMSFLDGPKIVHTHRDCSSNKICVWQRTQFITIHHLHLHHIHHLPNKQHFHHVSLLRKHLISGWIIQVFLVQSVSSKAWLPLDAFGMKSKTTENKQGKRAFKKWNSSRHDLILSSWNLKTSYRNPSSFLFASGFRISHFKKKQINRRVRGVKDGRKQQNVSYV